MIFVNQPIKYNQLTVQMYDGDFDAFFNKQWERKGEFPGSNVCHVSRDTGKWPAGVTPVAIRASTQFQGFTRIQNISAVGIGLTKAKAHLDAQDRLRKKLTKVSKDVKGTITYGPDEVVICTKMNKSNLFGRGKTFKDACNDLVNNKIKINSLLDETSSGYDPKMDEVPDLREPKRWYQFWK